MKYVRSPFYIIRRVEIVGGVHLTYFYGGRRDPLVVSFDLAHFFHNRGDAQRTANGWAHDGNTRVVGVDRTFVGWRPCV